MQPHERGFEMWFGSTPLVEGLPVKKPQRFRKPSRKSMSITLAQYQLCEFALGKRAAPDNVRVCVNTQLVDVYGGVTWCVADKDVTDENFLGRIGHAWYLRGSQLNFFGSTAITRNDLARRLKGPGAEPRQIVWTVTWRQVRRLPFVGRRRWEVLNSHATFVK